MLQNEQSGSAEFDIDYFNGKIGQVLFASVSKLFWFIS